MEPVTQFEYGNHTVYLHQDENPENPRNWDNLGTMLCAHKRYELGDKHSLTPEQIMEYKNRKDVVSLPLYLLDHSGIWMNTTGFSNVDPQRWDWGCVGYIVVTHETLRKEYHVTRVTKKVKDKAKEVLETEVEIYSKYLEGDVYGYRILDHKGREVDSCWGYFGTEDAENAAKDAIDLMKEGK